MVKLFKIVLNDEQQDGRKVSLYQRNFTIDNAYYHHLSLALLKRIKKPFIVYIAPRYTTLVQRLLVLSELGSLMPSLTTSIFRLA